MVWGWESASHYEKLIPMKITTNSNQPYLNSNVKASSSTRAEERIICFGIDQHADSLVVVGQENACVPSPARKYHDKTKLYDVIRSKQKAGFRVVACYEAGPCGYWLCRELKRLGVDCLVVAPKKWAENGKTKTDAEDARVLSERLFQYTQGRHNVFTVVRVPSEAEENRRNLSRGRERLIKERKRLAQSGRGVALTYQMRLKGQWWKGSRWTEIASNLDDLLGPIREVLLTIEAQIKAVTTRLECFAAAKEKRPAGLGALTDASIGAEVGDYHRFANRRGPGAFMGLVPGESSSGPSRRQLPITKAGSGMTRRFLVEAVWRLIRFQPEWRAWKKWQARYEDAPKWRRNQIVVALARELITDLWRLRTDQTTMEKLGWTPATT